MIDTKQLARSDARVETLRGPARVFAEAVEAGLGAQSKSLPAWAFYDREGSELFELITELPEYYPTRTERRIFQENADEIVATMAGADPSPITVIELGAGTATKSQIILQAVVRRQGRCLYVPVDVSHAALDIAEARLEPDGSRLSGHRPYATLFHQEAVSPVTHLGSGRGRPPD